MPLQRYALLCGRVVDARMAGLDQAHYQLHVIARSVNYRVAVNVRSQVLPADLEYLINPDFQHPVTTRLPGVAPGLQNVRRGPNGLALDYVRGMLFTPSQMRVLPASLPGPDNDLNEALDTYVRLAIADQDARVYAYGEPWGPERGVRDEFFGFQPRGGMHDVHMNQGNLSRFAAQDATWQDGALLLHLPSLQRWIAIMLKFQSQSWRTDDRTGHRIQ